MKVRANPTGVTQSTRFLRSIISLPVPAQHPSVHFWSQPLTPAHRRQGWSTATDTGVNVTLQVSVFLQQWRKWSKNDGVFVLWHSVSPRPHQGWASQTSSVNLGLLPSVSLSAARLGGGRWALAENDPSGLIVFWPTDWHWEEKQRHGKRARNREGGRERAKEWWLSANAPSSN